MFSKEEAQRLKKEFWTAFGKSFPVVCNSPTRKRSCFLPLTRRSRREKFNISATDAKPRNVVPHCKKADRTFKHIWFLPTRKDRTKNQMSLNFANVRKNKIYTFAFI